jgi:hypothetical protein
VDSAATRTAILDAIKPKKDSAQYGRACRRRERGLPCAHTHRRLSSKEGTVPIAVAMTFDHKAGKPNAPTSNPRIVSEVMVEIAYTDPYRMMR